MRLAVAFLSSVLFACVGASAQVQNVAADAGLDRVPELRQDLRPVADGDLLPALAALDGQHTLDFVRPPGRSEVTAPDRLADVCCPSLVVLGTVLRTQARLTPDLTGVATVLTVLVSGTLADTRSRGAPPPVRIGPPRIGPATTRMPRSSRALPSLPSTPVPAEVQGDAVLRFVLPGGTVFFDENNAVTVRQAGVRYPPPGSELVFAGNALSGSKALLLTAACALQQGRCLSIDGSALLSDADTAALPGGLGQAQALSSAGSPVAQPSALGMVGVAASLENRYSLCLGDLRQLDAVLPLRGCTQAAAADDLALVRGTVLSSTAALTSQADGLVEVSLVAVTQVLRRSEALAMRRGTLEVTQRGGLLQQANGTVFGDTEKLRLLVPGGDYFLEVGRTSDNRWETVRAWRIVGGRVYAMDTPRGTVPAANPAANIFWKDEAAFLRTVEK